jgi:hypothetical protein
MNPNRLSTRIFIATHFGLGDHILCNGIYRYFAKKYELCVLPVKNNNLVAVKRILSDVSNIIITPNKLLKNSNFFNYGYVLENAAEIHCIESSFAALIEILDIRVPKYVHRYARPEAANDFHHEFTYKSTWNIYE